MRLHTARASSPTLSSWSGSGRRADYRSLQSTKAAKTLYNTKILTLRSNLATLQAQIEKKNDNANAVVEVLKQKMAQQDQENRERAGGGGKTVA